MPYMSHTGCQWRFLPESFGPWTRVWSQFRRWSRNGTWARALTVLHAAARQADGRADATPSMVVIDTHLARGASNGGFTFHDRGGPYGRTKGAKRIVAVDVTGLPVGALVVPASTHETRASELMLEHLTRQGVTGRLELMLVDRGAPKPLPASSGDTTTSTCAASGGTTSSRCSAPSRTPGASKSPTAASTLPPTGEVVREHHLGDRLAASGLYRDHPAPPVTRTGAHSRWQPDRGRVLRGMRQIGPFARRAPADSS
jgi:putative transposase